ncbi:MAG: M1 family aminopeptidase [Rhodocyclaceae bacterium]|nr:M1 family aminopeptidase [Rhodocyclaceae bacterium]
MNLLYFRHPAGFLLGLLFCAASAFSATDPDLLLDVSLDPQSRQFKASAELQLTARSFRFLLHESLHVTRALVGDQMVTTERSGGPKGYKQWNIHLTKANQKVVIHYEGQLPALERDRDHRSVLGGMPPMAAPEGSFLSSGSGWYPRPADLFSYRVKLAVPYGQRALVAGKRLAESVPTGAGESYRASFEFTQPSDGIDLMAGPWVVREKTVKRGAQPPLHLRTFFPADLDALPGLAQAYLDDTATYIARYSRDIGAYPYSEFSIVASPLPTGFGMPTLTYLGAEVLRLPFIRKTSLGHEILHNWWGNGVYVDYERGNWSEGLTTFMADYAYKEDESATAASDMRLAWLRDAAVFAGEKPGSLRDFRSRANAAGATVGYGKSAMVFVMLRDRLGKKVFDQGIRNFWTAQRFKVASWDDLQAAFESASGEKLGSLFAPWLDQQALPAVSIAHAESSRSGKQHLLNLTFNKQDANLPLRLPLEIKGAGKRQTHWVDLAASSNSATLKLAFKPQSLRLDPEMRVWRRLEASQLPPILRQWMAAKAPLLINVARAPEANVAVNALSERIFELSPKPLAADQLTTALKGKAPVLLAGTHAEIDQALASADLPARPASLRDKGSAQVWTMADKPFQLAIISARDAAALNALQRGLPHYGGQSWLIFDQGRAVGKGIWPASIPEIAILSAAPKDKK